MLAQGTVFCVCPISYITFSTHCPKFRLSSAVEDSILIFSASNIFRLTRQNIIPGEWRERSGCGGSERKLVCSSFLLAEKPLKSMSNLF